MNTHLKGLSLAFLGVAIMSFESLLIKLTSTSATTFAFYFGLFMFLATFLVVLKQGPKKALLHYKTHLKAILLSGFVMGLSNFFFISSIKHTAVANTVFILSTAPIFSALMAFFVLKQKTPLRIFIATLFVFLGLYIILADGLGEGNMLGNLFALGCVCSFSALFVIFAKYKEVDRSACISAGALFASVLAFLSAPIESVDATSLYAIAFMGLLISPLSRVLVGNGTRYISPSETGLIMITESVLAPIWVWIFLAEEPSKSTLIGGSIILSTLILNSLYGYHVSKRKTQRSKF